MFYKELDQELKILKPAFFEKIFLEPVKGIFWIFLQSIILIVV